MEVAITINSSVTNKIFDKTVSKREWVKRWFIFTLNYWPADHSIFRSVCENNTAVSLHVLVNGILHLGLPAWTSGEHGGVVMRRWRTIQFLGEQSGGEVGQYFVVITVSSAYCWHRGQSSLLGLEAAESPQWLKCTGWAIFSPWYIHRAEMEKFIKHMYLTDQSFMTFIELLKLTFVYSEVQWNNACSSSLNL